MLSDIIVANRAEAPAIRAAGGGHSLRWAVADLKGIDTIKLNSLCQILAGDAAERISLDDALDEAPPDGPWIYLMPPKLVGKLASLDEESIETTAERWAATEEFVQDGLSAIDAEDYLNALKDMSRKAKAASTDLLFWMSL